MKNLLASDRASDSHILVVEDDEKSRRLLRDFLEAYGYQMSEAVDGEEALSVINAKPPDLILLDVMMPKMDGFEVCRRLKENEQTQMIPVLLVTALSDRADRLRGISVGATDFITKPIDTLEVLFRVRNALRTKHLYDDRNSLLRMREELSDMIVHDIRNPLLGITLCARRLETKNKSPAVIHLAKEILRQTQLLDNFISDLLTVSKIEQGQLTLQRSDEDLVACVQAAMRHHQIAAETEKIQLALVAPDGPVFARVDKSLIVRLLDNLLANAIKFSRQSCVTLTIKPAGDSGTPCLIQVEDEGPGIPLGYRDKIFEKYGIVKMKELELPQTGLGLAFCRMVAEAHGGRIYVAPRQPCGSIFSVELP
jgi:two-component system sensor histidine kinase/response regulator